MTENEIAFFLQGLKNEEERDFELSLTSFTSAENSKGTIACLYSIIDNPGYDEKTSYAAFYCIHIILRRNKDYELLKHLHAKYPEFQSHITYNHLRFLYLTESDSLYDYDELLESSHTDYIKIKENAGFSHLFANAFVTICERCDEQERLPYIEKWFDAALQAVDEAIRLDSTYAKYYCTKGRIVALRHKYMEAAKLIHYAVSLEDSSRKDYALRIGDYQFHALQAQLQRERHKSEKEIQELRDQLFGKTGTPVKKAAECPAPKAYEGDKSFAFVSYAHADSSIIYPLLRRLIGEDYRIWYDEGIKAGNEWVEFIADKVCDCEQTILFVSNSSINSPNVRKEINFALSENKQVIAVYIEDVLMSHGMRMQLDDVQSIPNNIYRNNDLFEVKLRTAISPKVKDQV